MKNVVFVQFRDLLNTHFCNKAVKIASSCAFWDCEVSMKIGQKTDDRLSCKKSDIRCFRSYRPRCNLILAPVSLLPTHIFLHISLLLIHHSAHL